MYKFEKLNDEPIVIEQIVYEENAELISCESFWWNNYRYYLKDFMRAHHNIWFGSGEDYPDYIHGIGFNNYHKLLYIELIDDEYVNVYEKKGVII